MANLRQDRVPDQTLSQASAPASQGFAADGSGTGKRALRGFVLALRMRTQDSGGSPVDVSWKSAAPAVLLTQDVLSASGGAPDPSQDPVLSAGFFNLQSAVLAARRVQWGLQGLRETESCHNVAAAMLIYSVQDLGGDAGGDRPGGAVPAALERAAPGQVLLSNSVAAAVQALPNVLLVDSVHAGWRELQWRSPEMAWTYAEDEESLLGLIRQLGRGDPCAPDGAAGVAPAAVAAGAETQSRTGIVEGLGRSHVDREVSAAGMKKWLIVGGAAAAVVLVAVMVIPAMVSGNHGKTAAQAPDASKTVSPAPANAPAGAAPGDTTKAASTGANSGASAGTTPGKTTQGKAGRQPKGPKTDGGGEAGAAKAGPCDLTEGEIPRSLSRAENYMYAGKLTEAQAVYQRVLGCPSAHEKAVEGLQRVRQRIAMQGSSGP